MKMLKRLLPLGLVVGACILAGIVMYVALKALGAHPPKKETPPPRQPLETKVHTPVSLKESLSTNEQFVSEAEISAHKPNLFVVVSGSASVSTASGPDVALEVVEYVRTCPDSRPQKLMRKTATSGWSKEVNLQIKTEWCVPVASTDRPVIRQLPGKWVSEDTALDVDSVNQYMVIQQPDGKAKAFRAIAVSYCPDEDSGCTGTVVLDFNSDDENLLVSLPLEKTGSSLLQLQ